MIRKFLNTLGSLLITLSALPLPSTASEDPVYWLEKMSSALKEQNYSGTFTYLRGTTFDTVRIVHVVDDGVEMERLFNLNGEEREMYREGDEARCYHADPGDQATEEIVDHSVYIGPFSAAFSDRVLSTQESYRLSYHGEDRIAGRDAVKLAISPKHNDRYGYRLWLDRDTGLLLQSHLIDRRRVREVFQFTELEVGDTVSEAELASAIEGETFSHELAFEAGDIAEKPVWRVNWLPDGFRPVRIVGNRLHFSDGLANFSVFVEQADKSSLPELATTVGGTVVITRRLANGASQITVVGEVPVQTARKVAESVEPVIY